MLIVVAILPVRSIGAPAFPGESLHGLTMGTTWRVTVPAPAPVGLSAEIQSRLDTLEARWSHYREDSEISRFNQSTSTNWFPVSADTSELVAKALDLSRSTGGAFDITVAPLVQAWGFGPGHGSAERSGAPNLATLEPKVGYQHLHVRQTPPALRKDIPALSLDLSAIAKGTAVDLLTEWLIDQGQTNVLVDIGGELKGHGTGSTGLPWRVGIRRPGGGGLQTVVTLNNLAIATSGTDLNRKRVGGQSVSHIVDPHTGKPVRPEVMAVSVIHESCATADALATALVVMGPEAGLEFAREKGLAVAYFIVGSGAIDTRMTDSFRMAQMPPGSAGN